MIHFKFGGSTAARTIGCAAWLRLSAELPKSVNGSNPAADMGTMLHDCMEGHYGGGMSIYNLLEDGGREHKGQVLTQELIDTKLTPAVNEVEDLFILLDIDTNIVEPMVKIDDDIGGSIDMIAISCDKKTVLILDYKFGFHSVSPISNKQLMFYALAAATDPATREWFDSCERIVMAIVQPNDSGEDCQTWGMSMDDLDAFESEYLEAVEATEEIDALPTAGVWCKYCPAHATCPVKTGAALKATRVNELTSDKLAEYLPLAEEVVAWAKEVQKMAYEQMELGTAIRGYKLVNKRASRVWNDATAVDKKVRLAKKIKIADAFDMKLKSPAQLEKVCKKLGVDFKAYTQYISSVSSGTTLAKQDDKRPAALPVAGLEQLNSMMD